MENIKIALVCGLCEGCKHAISLAYESQENNPTIIFKEIVHNKNVNNRLKHAGIAYAKELDEINPLSTVIIRAHGEPPETFEYFKKNNIKYLDGTCKNVKTIHSLIKEYSNLGYQIVIIGKYGKHSGIIHPEVFGSAGYALQLPILIEDIEDVKKINSLSNSKIFVVCQTTFNPLIFKLIEQKIIEICKINHNELIIKNTICGAQQAIQKSSLNLANQSDIMIVVGGKNSSNSIELYNNLKRVCPSIFIENIYDYADELKKNNISISRATKIGITAGASTDKAELVKLKSLIEQNLSKN